MHRATNESLPPLQPEPGRDLSADGGDPTDSRGSLARATTSAVAALQRFSQGLHDDYAAVKAGVPVPWSNSPVEGHINRLKMLKRQMFGRAHLDLLGHRFLRVPRERRAYAAGSREPAPPQDRAA